jgi:hypothetical protein
MAMKRKSKKPKEKRNGAVYYDIPDEEAIREYKVSGNSCGEYYSTFEEALNMAIVGTLEHKDKHLIERVVEVAVVEPI